MMFAAAKIAHAGDKDPFCAFSIYINQLFSMNLNHETFPVLKINEGDLKPV